MTRISERHMEVSGAGRAPGARSAVPAVELPAAVAARPTQFCLLYVQLLLGRVMRAPVPVGAPVFLMRLHQRPQSML